MTYRVVEFEHALVKTVYHVDAESPEAAKEAVLSGNVAEYAMETDIVEWQFDARVDSVTELKRENNER